MSPISRTAPMAPVGTATGITTSGAESRTAAGVSVESAQDFGPDIAQ